MQVATAQADKIEPKVITPTQLQDALRSIYDLMEHYMYEWYPIRDTADAIKANKPLTGEKIYGVMHVRFYTPLVKQDIETQLGHMKVDYDITNDYFKYDFKGVPVDIRIMKRRYMFFNHPNPVFYNFDEYQLANPWDKYYPMRFMLR